MTRYQEITDIFGDAVQIYWYWPYIKIFDTLTHLYTVSKNAPTLMIYILKECV